MYKIGLFFLLAFFLIGGPLIYFVVKIDETTTQDYKKLEEKSSEKNELGMTYSQQKRNNVVKEVWYQDNGQKLNFRITSDNSTLFLFQENNQLEVVEQMEKVFCFMQEELFYLLPNGKEALLQENKLLLKRQDPKNPDSWLELKTSGAIPMQVIRYLEAEKAYYNYNSHIFMAENVKLFRYRVKGHDLITLLKSMHPFMSGTAKSVQFSMEGRELLFTAQQFKATFETAGGL